MSTVKVSPPLSTRARPQKPTIIVLHATAGATGTSSIDHLRGEGLSYHYIIARDGRDSASTAKSDGSEPIVYHCTEEKFRASHVGSKVPPPVGSGSFNDLGVGISLTNRQNGEAYTPKQLVALDAVIAAVKVNAPTVTHLTTHAVIQPWNRSDPLQIDGKAVAKKHGLTWFEPDQATIAKHDPGKMKKPKK
jgi:N-acetyl-anhydromuramyl-L-alanine amidase AmpD